MLSVRHRRAIRLASRFIAPYRWHAFGALLALIVTAGITLSMGQGIRLLVDQGFMTQSPHLLNQSIGLFMLLVFGLAVGTFARFYLVSWIGERCVADIRRQVFNHLIYLHPGFYENNRSSEIQSRLTADTTLLQSVIGSSLSLVSTQSADGHRRDRPAVCHQPQTHQYRRRRFASGDRADPDFRSPGTQPVAFESGPDCRYRQLCLGNPGSDQNRAGLQPPVSGRATFCLDRGRSVRHGTQAYFPAGLVDHIGDRAGAGRGRRHAVGRWHGRHCRANFCRRAGGVCLL